MMLSVRQLITRVSDELHEKLKRKAAAEGRSMNALVTEVLEEATVETGRDRYYRRLEAEGRRVFPPQPEGEVPDLDELLREQPPGAGQAVLDALLEDRRAP